MERGTTHLLLLALLLGGAGCDGSSGGSPEPSATPTLVGHWVSDPTLSQLGRIVYTWDFTADGAFSMAADFEAQIPDIVVRGTYQAREGALQLTGTEKPAEMTYAFEGDVLLLTERNGDAYRLRRR